MPCGEGTGRLRHRIDLSRLLTGGFACAVFGGHATCDDDVVRANEVEPDGYGELLSRLKERMRASRVRASRAANTELMRLYWTSQLVQEASDASTRTAVRKPGGLCGRWREIWHGRPLKITSPGSVVRCARATRVPKIGSAHRSSGEK